MFIITFLSSVSSIYHPSSPYAQLSYALLSFITKLPLAGFNNICTTSVNLDLKTVVQWGKKKYINVPHCRHVCTIFHILAPAVVHNFPLRSSFLDPGATTLSLYDQIVKRQINLRLLSGRSKPLLSNFEAGLPHCICHFCSIFS